MFSFYPEGLNFKKSPIYANHLLLYVLANANATLLIENFKPCRKNSKASVFNNRSAKGWITWYVYENQLTRKWRKMNFPKLYGLPSFLMLSATVRKDFRTPLFEWKRVISRVFFVFSSPVEPHRFPEGWTEVCLNLFFSNSWKLKRKIKQLKNRISVRDETWLNSLIFHSLTKSRSSPVQIFIIQVMQFFFLNIVVRQLLWRFLNPKWRKV